MSKKNKHTEDMDDNFKALAIKFLKIDDIIKEKRANKKEVVKALNNELKVAIEHRKEYEKSLVGYMDEINSTKIEVGEFNILEKKEKIKRKPLNNDFIKKILSSESIRKKLADKNEKKMEELIKDIDKRRIISKEEIIVRKIKKHNNKNQL